MSARSNQLRLESEVLELRQLVIQLTLRVEELESRASSELGYTLGRSVV